MVRLRSIICIAYQSACPVVHGLQGYVSLTVCFCEFVLHGIPNTGRHPKNKNTSFRPFNGNERQNCLATRTVLPNDVQGVKKKEEKEKRYE